MKFNPRMFSLFFFFGLINQRIFLLADVSRSRRKARRRHFNAPSHIRQKIMCCALSKALCKEYGVPRLTMPIHRDDEVKVVRGKFKDEPPSKVVTVQRRRYRLYLENVQRDKANGLFSFPNLG